MKEATRGQDIKLLTLFEEKDAGREKTQQLLESGLLSDLLEVPFGGLDRERFRRDIGYAPQVAHEVCEAGLRIVKCPTYKLSHSGKGKRLIETLAEAAGLQRQPGYINDEDFPLPPKAPREFEVCLFPPALVREWDQGGSSVITGRGFRHSNVAELLSLALTHPTFQRVFHIIVFGQKCRANGYCPYLGIDCSEKANRAIFVAPEETAKLVVDGTHDGWLIAATKVE